ncbi:hypothetical protein [Caedibacter taeniospiralis]|nr:hypothetical protein [Caedibacter taeniospiralis]
MSKPTNLTDFSPFLFEQTQGRIEHTIRAEITIKVSEAKHKPLANYKR